MIAILHMDFEGSFEDVTIFLATLTPLCVSMLPVSIFLGFYRVIKVIKIVKVINPDR